MPVYNVDGEKATLKQCVQIAAIEGGSKASIHRGKVAIIFGSYSCPVWRGAAAKLSTVAFFTRGIPVRACVGSGLVLVVRPSSRP